MKTAVESVISPRKDYEPIHPNSARMNATEDNILGEDAVSEAQGYGSRPSSPDFSEGLKPANTPNTSGGSPL